MIALEKHLEINSKNFMVIINHLNSSGGKARLIGGAVRDSLLNIECSDIDIATDLLLEQVITILSKFGIKVIPTGIKFGTVTVIVKDESFEITTLRKDIDCDGRHASVEYSDDFAEDAMRRDFTINALSYCPLENKIYDYSTGLEDLEAKKVVFIGDAGKRVQEDYLRILRFFRFSARYANKIDLKGLNVCKRYKKHLKDLSRERIKSEIDGLLLSKNSSNMLEVMKESGILSEILPVKKYDAGLHQLALSLCEQFNVSPSSSLIYSILFMHSDDITFSNLIGLKFSRAQTGFILKMLDLTKLHDNSDINFALKNIWLEEKAFVQYFIFASLLVKDSQFICNLYFDLLGRELPIFPVTGDDMLRMGFQGKEIGRVLGELKKRWIESNFSLSESSLIDMVVKNEE